jgi:glycosyltransferase involved in cell wall biosynthesis
VVQTLAHWRQDGLAAARSFWLSRGREASCHPHDTLGPLARELDLRLAGAPGPRLLVDGVWFCRPPGGIGRVWEQILRCWGLPGMVTPQAPIRLIDRDSHLALTAQFDSVPGQQVDPLAIPALAALEAENLAHAQAWDASVFLSSWISTCARRPGALVPELALVHDCLPERSTMPADLAQQRRRWLLGSAQQLAVSSATAQDLESLLRRPCGSVPWCHAVADGVFAQTVAAPGAERLWAVLQRKAGLQPAFVLLPATSAIGSYKNPELVAEAVARIPGLQLVLCGVGADQRRLELVQAYPDLQGRCQGVGFTEVELALAYRHALAVVVPSRVEGFGLPAIEALSAGGRLIVAESRGLREAAGEAGLRVDPVHPLQLEALLKLLLDAPSRSWLDPLLEQRRRRRLERCCPDLLGLALLAQARSL